MGTATRRDARADRGIPIRARDFIPARESTRRVVEGSLGKGARHVRRGPARHLDARGLLALLRRRTGLALGGHRVRDAAVGGLHLAEDLRGLAGAAAGVEIQAALAGV